LGTAGICSLLKQKNGNTLSCYTAAISYLDLYHFDCCGLPCLPGLESLDSHDLIMSLIVGGRPLQRLTCAVNPQNSWKHRRGQYILKLETYRNRSSESPLSSRYLFIYCPLLRPPLAAVLPLDIRPLMHTHGWVPFRCANIMEQLLPLRRSLIWIAKSRNLLLTSCTLRIAVAHRYGLFPSACLGTQWWLHLLCLAWQGCPTQPIHTIGHHPTSQSNFFEPFSSHIML
jgi:hypothetical protein